MVTSAEPTLDRGKARRRAFELIRGLQSGEPGSATELAELFELAESNQWPEVIRLGLFGRAVHAWTTNRLSLRAAVQAMLTRCERDGDPVLAALALSMRSDLASPGTDPAEFAEGDADLARAAILLETVEGRASERIAAHSCCGMAFVNRSLWELGDRQYRLALALSDEEDDEALDVVLAPVVFNRAEAKVAWASALRQMGDRDAVTKLWCSWSSDMEVADAFAMPFAWRTELAALGLLIAALAGQDVCAQAIQLLDSEVKDPVVERHTIGHLKLAMAVNLADARHPDAARSAEAAVSAVDPDLMPHMFNLALHVAAEVDDVAGHGAGLRCARRQFALHWSGRLAKLGAMQLRLDSERLAAERDTLRREANLDDLTGIGNRRALNSFLNSLRDRGVGRIALLMVDLDGFKAVNDKYGHLAGDTTLRRVADVLGASVRRADLAVRLGGDEFALILTGIEFDAARARAQQLLEDIKELPWSTITPGLEVSASIGVAAGPLANLENLNARADAALYAAKAAGGNTVVSG